jgi:hypothetical protein
MRRFQSLALSPKAGNVRLIADLRLVGSTASSVSQLRRGFSQCKIAADQFLNSASIRLLSGRSMPNLRN